MHLSVSLSEYLKADRQWPRRLRIEHARMMLRHSSGWPEAAVRGDTKFWRDVLKANGAKA